MLFLDLQWVWEAYRQLDARRTHSQSFPDPIQFSELVAYAEYFDIVADDDRDFLVRAILAMDVVYLADASDKAKLAARHARSGGRGEAPPRRRQPQ